MKALLIFGIVAIFMFAMVFDVNAASKVKVNAGNYCTQIITTVCGSNGVTYTFGSPCSIKLPSGVAQAHYGACVK